MHTILEPEKQLRTVRGSLAGSEAKVTGYEIHSGVTSGPALENPVVLFDTGGTDGAASNDGQILGTYLHGVFETKEACLELLRWAGLADAKPMDYAALRESAIERLADTVDAHLDMVTLTQLLGLKLTAKKDAAS